MRGLCCLVDRNNLVVCAQYVREVTDHSNYEAALEAAREATKVAL
ncbi:hypothetical protein [Ammoniphilus sp. 3BR4]